MARYKPDRSVNDRIWWAYNCMERNGDTLPFPNAVDAMASLTAGTMSKIFRGEVRPATKRISAIAHALKVDEDWLRYNVGEAPECEYPVPPRPRRFDDLLDNRYSSISGKSIANALAKQGLNPGWSERRVYELLEEQQLDAFEIYIQVRQEAESPKAEKKASSKAPLTMTGGARSGIQKKKATAGAKTASAKKSTKRAKGQRV